MIVRTPQYVLDKIERAVWDGIQEGYHGEDVFGPVYVVEHPDVFGEDVIHIYIVYDGKDKTLDYDFQSDVVENIRCNVTLDEMPFAPSVQFHHKSSWKTALAQVGKWIPKS